MSDQSDPLLEEAELEFHKIQETAEATLREFHKIQETAATLMDKAKEGGLLSDLNSSIQIASEVLKLGLEIDNGKIELEKIALEKIKLKHENRSMGKHELYERTGALVSLCTPLLSIITLAATLVFQVYQYRQTDLARKEVADEAAWKSALDVLSKSTKLTPEVLAIRPFLHSPKHADEAMAVALQLMSNSTDTALFEDLFRNVLSPVDWNNIDQVLKLNNVLSHKTDPLYDKSFNIKTHENDIALLSESEKQLFEYMEYVQPIFCAEVGALIKSTKPQDKVLDLSGTRFDNCDFSGVSLKNALINNLSLFHVNINGANIDAIEFGWLNFYGTAWWEAAKLSPPLRKFLQEKYPCDPSVKYGRKVDEQFSAEQCAKVNSE